jgi:hypothetical protein
MDATELKNKVLKELGAENISAEAQNELLVRIGENIMKRSTLAILKALSISDQEEFSRIADTGNYQAAHAFASSKINNMDELMAKEARDEISDFKKLAGL